MHKLMAYNEPRNVLLRIFNKSTCAYYMEFSNIYFNRADLIQSVKIICL